MPNVESHPAGFDYSVYVLDRNGQWQEMGIDADPNDAVRKARSLLQLARSQGETSYSVRVMHRASNVVVLEESI